MTDRTDRDGAQEREELLEELEENHERSKHEAANPERVEPIERDDRGTKKGRGKHDTEHDEANPPRTTTGFVTAPKFGSAGSGGAELEPGPGKN